MPEALKINGKKEAGTLKNEYCIFWWDLCVKLINNFSCSARPIFFSLCSRWCSACVSDKLSNFLIGDIYV